jgi:hypothetical protein
MLRVDAVGSLVFVRFEGFDRGASLLHRAGREPCAFASPFCP